MIGGMSWESTQLYYRLLNEGVRERLGGLRSAKVVLWSLDFGPVARFQEEGDWDGAARLLGAAARGVEAAGADFLLICANTMHRVFPDVERQVGIPLLHVADAAGEAVRAAGLRRVGLLGTRFTMEGEFYRERLAERHGLEVGIPGEADRERVHRVIYDELCVGRIRDGSRRAFAGVLGRLADAGCEGVILGCTEIPLPVAPGDSPVPLFDTTALHARAAVDRALAGERRPNGGRP